MHGRAHCEYSIKLINYDLIGREASTETIIWYRPGGITVYHSNLIYIYPILLLIITMSLLKCCMFLCCSNTTRKHFILLSGGSKRDTVTIL